MRFREILAHWLSGSTVIPKANTSNHGCIVKQQRGLHPRTRFGASWLESHLSNKKLNGQVVGEVASRWVESDPQAASSRVESLKGTRVYDKELAKRLGGAWARKDPDAAFQWAKGLETDLWRPASASIVGNMSREQFCKTHPGSSKAPPKVLMMGFGLPTQCEWLSLTLMMPSSKPY